MSFKKNHFRTNNGITPRSPELEFIQPDKKQSAVIRRMVEIVMGTKSPIIQTRSDKLLYYMVLVTTASAWWYWLRQVERYRIETMIEQGMFVYDERGKLIVTEEYQKAAYDPYMVTAVNGLLVSKKVVKLEEEISAFKEERERILEMLENQKRIDSKLQSIEAKLSK